MPATTLPSSRFLLLVSLIALPILIPAQSIEYKNGTFRLLKNLPIKQSPKASKLAYWDYFWEFGDGHYSDQKEPKHRYEKKGGYIVRLRLTPYYSPSPSVTIVESVEVTGGTGAPTETYPGAKSVFITSSTASRTNAASVQGDIVPGNSYDFALHYRYASKEVTNGLLVFFYNKIEEFKHENAFSIDKNDDQAVRIRAGEQLLRTSLEIPEYAEKARGLKNQYGDYIAFRIPDMPKGTDRRLFFTVLAEPGVLGKYREKGKTVTFAAVWLPGGAQKGSEFEDEFKAEIHDIHDPNRISVSPNIAYFRKHKHETLDYAVRFQNEGEGVARDVTIKVPLDKGLNGETVSVTAMDPKVPVYDPAKPDEPSYQVLKELNAVKFVFRNIGLEGKQNFEFFDSKKSTKGSIRFSIENNKKRRPDIRAKAFIYFEENKPVVTNTSNVHWRQRGFFLNMGGSPNPKSETFEKLDASFNIGLGYQNAPVGIGWSRSFELNFNKLSLTRSAGGALDSSPILPDGGFYSTTETLDLSMIDLKANWGYQFFGALRASAGLGIVLPAFGDVNLTGWISEVNLEDAPHVLEDAAHLGIGMFKSGEPVEFFQQEVEPPTNIPGFTLQGNVEFGFLHSVSLGAGYEFRRLNKSYTGECINITGVQVFAKLKLATL